MQKDCSQPGCEGPRSGVCIENFTFDDCPHLVGSDNPGLDAAGLVESPEATSGDFVVVSRGGAALDLRECDALLRQRDARVVGIIAGPNAGKTTLLAAIYELARRRRIDGAVFCGSETILGFEERVHLSRQQSDLDEPDTQRTRVGSLGFLHLRLAGDDDPVDLIMADRPGEDFERALEKPQVLENYEEIARATHLLLVVDGAQLMADQHAAAATARRTFLAFIERELNVRAPLYVVVTKADLFHGEEVKVLQDRGRALLSEYQRRAPDRDIRLHLTAARARRGESHFGDGVAELANALIEKNANGEFTSTQPAVSATDSGIDRLMRRVIRVK